ncbi:HAD-IIB family hydrolase [Salininema proteolyticum]|uniref:HAD-IIB family hydrolase n=1 Tax=Salininema proteolyticum TaxID=1607685 RepID=A0ABV8U0E4_9ACTN
MSLGVIATDLDRTLLRTDKSLSDRSHRALLSARRAGWEIAAVTARPPRVLDEWTLVGESVDVALCAGGAITYRPSTHEVLASRTIAAETALACSLALKAAVPGLTVAVETGFEVVAEPAYERVDSVGERRITAADTEAVFSEARQIAKLLFHHPERTADELLTAAREADPSGVDFSHSGGAGLLEVTAEGVEKAGALEEWCASLGVRAGDVVAFGDAPNDVPMLKWAGRSFAVANAHPEALAAAEERTSSNDEDGVAEVVEALLDGEEPDRVPAAP